MRRSFFQVTGRGSWLIDHPNGNSVAYRPGDTFEESPLNRSVQRGLRTKRLREMDPREVKHLKALKAQPQPAAVKSGPPPASVRTKSPSEAPIVVLDDQPDPAE